MGLTEIQERISKYSGRSWIPGAKEEIKKCITELKDLLLDCGECSGKTFGICSGCTATQRTMGKALELLRNHRRRSE